MFILYTLTSSTGVGSLAEVSYLYPLRTGFKIINIDAKSRHCESAFKCRVEDNVSKRSMLEKTIRGSILIFFFFFGASPLPCSPSWDMLVAPYHFIFSLEKRYIPHSSVVRVRWLASLRFGPWDITVSFPLDYVSKPKHPCTTALLCLLASLPSFY